MNYIANIIAYVVILSLFIVFLGMAIRSCDYAWDTVKDIRIPGIIISDGDTDGDNDSELSPFEQGRKAGRKFIEDMKNGK